MNVASLFPSSLVLKLDDGLYVAKLSIVALNIFDPGPLETSDTQLGSLRQSDPRLKMLPLKPAWPSVQKSPRALSSPKMKQAKVSIDPTMAYRSTDFSLAFKGVPKPNNCGLKKALNG